MLKGGKALQVLLKLGRCLLEATFTHVDALDVTCSSNQYALLQNKPRARACPCYTPTSDDTIDVTPAVPRKGLPDMFTC